MCGLNFKKHLTKVVIVGLAIGGLSIAGLVTATTASADCRVCTHPHSFAGHAQGQNTPAIAAWEAEYAEMWAQDIVAIEAEYEQMWAADVAGMIGYFQAH